ncbi:hypothetical protein JH26_25665 [Microvirga sp. BSC39]|nr:hypothetical protein JH26_25665 [Microvirga sp. BSC39]
MQIRAGQYIGQEIEDWIGVQHPNLRVVAMGKAKRMSLCDLANVPSLSKAVGASLIAIIHDNQIAGLCNERGQCALRN